MRNYSPRDARREARANALKAARVARLAGASFSLPAPFEVAAVASR